MKAIAFRKSGPSYVSEEVQLPEPLLTPAKALVRVVAGGVDHQIHCFEAAGQVRNTELDSKGIRA